MNGENIDVIIVPEDLALKNILKFTNLSAIAKKLAMFAICVRKNFQHLEPWRNT